MTCTDCIHFDLCCEQDYVLTGSITAEKECKHFTRGWIPVSDKLPPVGEWALVYHAVFRCVFAVTRRKSGDHEARWCEINDYTPIQFQSQITHWRPFPDPPKEDI